MVDHNATDAFDDCVERLAAGQSLDDCLNRYPDFAAQFRPMLEAGRLVTRQDYAAEIAQAKARVQLKFEAHRRQKRSTVAAFRFATAFVIVLIVGVAGLAAAAQSSLPGDTLYSVKRISENVVAGVYGSSTLTEQLARRRLDEVRAVLSLNRQANVEFQGAVQAIQGIKWRVADLDVTVALSAPPVKIGDTVDIQAVTTAQGELIASAVSLVSSQALLPTPTATVTASPTSTVAPSITPTPTNTPVPTRLPVIRRTPVPPTSTPVPPTASSGGGSNSGGGSSSGSGSGGSSGGYGGGGSPSGDSTDHGDHPSSKTGSSSDN